MPTICRAYANESDAHAAVTRLLDAGVPGDGIRVLMGEHERDARDVPAGRFGGEAVEGSEPVGSFAGATTSNRDAMGAYAGHDGEQRRGGFADRDRDTVTSYPGGVAREKVSAHRGLKQLLLDAGLDEPTAAADVRALHEGRILVLVQSSEPVDAIVDGVR